MFNPIRCYNCGKVMPYSQYDKLREEGYSSLQAFDKLGIIRICCTRHILARPPENPEIFLYPNAGKRYIDVRNH